MNEKDYILKLVKASTQLLVTIVSGKNVMDSLVTEEKNDIKISEDDLFLIIISKYINDGKINEAENLIFEHINGCRSAINFEIALSFYRKLSQWSDEQLSKVNFSREEIIDGITEVKSMYEIKR